MKELARQIDAWMRQQDRWVHKDEIVARFGVDERRLRFDGNKPGLLSYNCISSSILGYKHIERCTDAEFIEAHDRDVKPLKTRFFVLRKRRNARRARFTRPLPLAAVQPEFFT